MKKLIATVALLCGIFLPGSNSQAQQCGSAASTNLVIMLDVSASMNAAAISAQKTAARNLINSFQNYTVRPLIAVGTFNTDCCSNGCNYQGTPSCATCTQMCNQTTPANQARMLTTLSADYTAALAQVAASGGIVGSGANGAGVGGTNLQRAIEVARAELDVRGNPHFNDAMVVVNDGGPTFPGYFNPNQYCFNRQCPFPEPYQAATCPPASNSFCPAAESAAMNAADSICAQGFRVITAHYGATNVGGPTFLEQVSCAPNNANSFIPPAGNFSLAGVAAMITTAAPCPPTPTRTPTRTATATPTGVPPVITPTATPTPTPTPPIVVQCTQIDATAYSLTIDTTARSQNTQLKRLLKDIKLRITRCPNRRATQAFITKTTKQGNAAFSSLDIAANSIQSLILSCPASAGCISAAVTFDSASVSKASSTLRALTRAAAKTQYQCRLGGGRCNGTARECANRAKLRRSQYRDELKRADMLNTENVSTVNAVPKTQSICR